jgi:glycerol uptake facilitator-like aquaporin
MAASLVAKTVIEFLGTAFFLGTILLTAGMASQFAIVGAALAVAIFVGAGVFRGDAHFNPAVSTMLLSRGGIDHATWVAFVVAQIAGGLAASAGASALKK